MNEPDHLTNFEEFNRLNNKHCPNPPLTVHTPISIFTVSYYRKFCWPWWKDVLSYPFSNRGFFWDLYQFYHRGRYGWAPADTWNLDSYLARVIGAGLNYYINNSHSYPGYYPIKDSDVTRDTPSDETGNPAWSAAVKRWSKAFSDMYYYVHNYGELAYYQNPKYPTFEDQIKLTKIKEDQLEKDVATSMKEMGEWFRHLWD